MFDMACNVPCSSSGVALRKSVRRKLDLDEPRINRMETEVTRRSPSWKKKKGRRLDFGESEVAMFGRCLGEFLLISCQFAFSVDSYPLDSFPNVSQLQCKFIANF